MFCLTKDLILKKSQHKVYKTGDDLNAENSKSAREALKDRKKTFLTGEALKGWEQGFLIMDKDLEVLYIRGETKPSVLITKWQNIINREEGRASILLGSKAEELFSQGKVFALKEGIKLLRKPLEKEDS